MSGRESGYREVPLRRLALLLGAWLVALVALAVAGVVFQVFQHGSEFAIFGATGVALLFLFSWTRPKVTPRPHPAAALRPAFGSLGRRGPG